MKTNLIMNPLDFSPTFLSVEKDLELILRRLFVESNPYSEQIKRLLVLNVKDCLDNFDSRVYAEKISKYSLKKLCEEGYVNLAPKVPFKEHEEIKSFLIVTVGEIEPTRKNNEFKNYYLNFDILCHTDYWDLGNFRVRPLKIAGYIDGILNKKRIGGLGKVYLVQCSPMFLDENVAGYSLQYRVVHGAEEHIPEAVENE